MSATKDVIYDVVRQKELSTNDQLMEKKFND